MRQLAAALIFTVLFPIGFLWFTLAALQIGATIQGRGGLFAFQFFMEVANDVVTMNERGQRGVHMAIGLIGVELLICVFWGAFDYASSRITRTTGAVGLLFVVCACIYIVQTAPKNPDWRNSILLGGGWFGCGLMAYVWAIKLLARWNIWPYSRLEKDKQFRDAS